MNAGLGLEVGEFALEIGPLDGGQNVGVIDDTARQGWRIGRPNGCEGQRRGDRQRESGGEPARERRDAAAGQNFTFGTASEPCAAVNSARGLALRKKVDAQITSGKVRSAVL